MRRRGRTGISSPGSPPGPVLSHLLSLPRPCPGHWSPEVRPTAPCPGVEELRPNRDTGQLSSIWFGFEKEPREVLWVPPCLAHHPHSGVCSPARVGGGGLVTSFLGNPLQHRAQGWDPQGVQQAPLGPLLTPSWPWAQALSTPWRVSFWASASQRGKPMSKTGPSTEPQSEGRRVRAKACKITGRSRPNHSPSRGEPAGAEA